MNANEPVCVATLLCESVIEDKRTNNKSLINLFNQVIVRELPFISAKLTLLVSIANVTSNTEIVAVLRAPSGRTAVELRAPVHAATASHIHDLVLELMGFQFEEFGLYFWDIVHKQTLLGSRSFLVGTVPEGY